jgi:hypothetical protein
VRGAAPLTRRTGWREIDRRFYRFYGLCITREIVSCGAVVWPSPYRRRVEREFDKLFKTFCFFRALGLSGATGKSGNIPSVRGFSRFLRFGVTAFSGRLQTAKCHTVALCRCQGAA